MRRGLCLSLIATLPLLGACTETFRQTQPSYGGASYAEAATATTNDDSAAAKNVFVTTDKNITRDCTIVAVFDVHTRAESQDKGFDELRARAAAVGADAVIGAEFEHGDGDEPSHLSGMAVKYSKPLPPYDPIAQIDIPSNEDDEDKGLEKMVAEAASMGADRVVNVQFEHGEEGKMGHLTGTAVKFRR